MPNPLKRDRTAENCDSIIEYFLGTHQPGWLRKTTVPLFVSYPRLLQYQDLPRSQTDWALDSGGFTQLLKHGRWTTSPSEYADTVRRLAKEVGRLKWASIQDWLCAPASLHSTGLSVLVHQRRTVDSLYRLRSIAPDVRWLPILQGWTPSSYLDHLGMYRAAGFALERERLVGVGSLAQRQQAPALIETLAALHDAGLNIHAFGLSIAGLSKARRYIASSTCTGNA